MHFRFKSTLPLVAVLMLPLLFGCGSSEDSKKTNAQGQQEGHAEEGPHGGHLIELGRDHKFHAELVEDHETDSISVYILDGNMKEYPIAEPDVTLAVSVGVGSGAYVLPAVEPKDGKTARFDVTDEKLHKQMESEGAEIKLRVTIDGTPYTGTLKSHKH